MTTRPLRARFLLAELRRRHVFRVAAAYVLAAWVILQVVDVVAPALGFPPVILRSLVWLSVTGLPVALVLAWIFEWTPEGVRTDASEPDAGRHSPSAPAGPARSRTPAADRRESAARAGSVAAAGTAEDVRRLIVLPFRMLRPDSDTEFLAFALPDAITCNLASIRSLIVRSSIAASVYDPSADLRVLAREADVDVVLTGTVLRAGSELEVRTQLTDARDGTLLWSQALRERVENLFGLQEQVTRRVVEALALPLSAGEHQQLNRDAPRSPRAYELYLRANQLSLQVSQGAAALELYRECLLEDPDYAPAWARAARCHRLLAKYATDPEVAESQARRAEEAFRRALELNPHLPLAHSLYADLEVDTNRAEQAMVRLLGRLEANGPQPEILAGLVQACRFCGLLEESLAAHRLARKLDPLVRTSVAHTFFMAKDYAAALGAYNNADIGYMEGIALVALGRSGEAVERLRAREAMTPGGPALMLWVTSLRAMLEGKRDESLATLAVGAAGQRDGEALYYAGRQLAFMDEYDSAMANLQRSLARGYFCYPALITDPWLEGLREKDEFNAYAAAARARHERAADAFEVAGGRRLLQRGPSVSRPATAPA